MKLIEFFGPSNSGKTTAISEITGMLKAADFSVATVKSTHGTLDYENGAKDSVRYLEAGSSLSVSLGKNESVMHFPERIDMAKLLERIRYDFVIIEGETGFPAPKILFLKGSDGTERFDSLTVGVVGKSELPARHLEPGDWKALFDFVISNATEPLPGDDCGHCGLDCSALLAKILKHEKKIEDCAKLSPQKAIVEIDGKRLPLLPFISSIIADANGGILRNLKGIDGDCKITVKFDFKK